MGNKYNIFKESIKWLNKIQFEIVGEFSLILGAIIIGIHISKQNFSLGLGILLASSGVIMRMMLRVWD